MTEDFHRATTLPGFETWHSAKQRSQCQLHVHGVFNTADVPCLTVDADGRISDWSPQLANLLRFTKEEICGFKFMDLITTDVSIPVADMIDKAQRSSQWMTVAIPLYTKDARKVSVTLHAFLCAKNQGLYIVIKPLPTSPESCKAKRCSAHL